jgi:hypothetical protein
MSLSLQGWRSLIRKKWDRPFRERKFGKLLAAPKYNCLFWKEPPASLKSPILTQLSFLPLVLLPQQLQQLHENPVLHKFKGSQLHEARQLCSSHPTPSMMLLVSAI